MFFIIYHRGYIVKTRTSDHPTYSYFITFELLISISIITVVLLYSVKKFLLMRQV